MTEQDVICHSGMLSRWEKTDAHLWNKKEKNKLRNAWIMLGSSVRYPYRLQRSTFLLTNDLVGLSLTHRERSSWFAAANPVNNPDFQLYFYFCSFQIVSLWYIGSKTERVHWTQGILFYHPTRSRGLMPLTDHYATLDAYTTVIL